MNTLYNIETELVIKNLPTKKKKNDALSGEFY